MTKCGVRTFDGWFPVMRTGLQHEQVLINLQMEVRKNKSSIAVFESLGLSPSGRPAC